MALKGAACLEGLSCCWQAGTAMSKWKAQCRHWASLAAGPAQEKCLMSPTRPTVALCDVNGIITMI